MTIESGQSILAIDPGESVGIAEYRQRLFDGPVSTTTEPVRSFLAMLGTEGVRYLSEFDVIVIEDYEIRPDTAQTNVGNDAAKATIGLIAVVRFIVENIIPVGYTARVPKIVMQRPGIKTAVDAQMEPRKIYHVGTTRHERDAELHLYYYLLRGSHGED